MDAHELDGLIAYWRDKLSECVEQLELAARAKNQHAATKWHTRMLTAHGCLDALIAEKVAS